jgi:putative transcriptional regulator
MSMPNSNKYPGYLLVANTNNPRDELHRGVILLVNHTDDLAVGIQLNNQLTNMTLKEIAVNTGIEWEGEFDDAEPLYYGGSHNSTRVHVIHTPDWRGSSTVMINSEIAVTNDISVLAAISRGEGPKQYRACAGHWIWNAGDLNMELAPKQKRVSHKWEVAPATGELVFDYEGADQWRQALLESAHHSAAQWF